MNITVYVPARLDSQRLPRKALRLFNGKPLVSRVLLTLRDCETVSKFCINTESEEIADIARDLSVDVYMRNPVLSTSSTSTEEILADFVKHVTTEFVAAINPTNPLIKPSTIDEFFSCQVKNLYDTAFSVSEIRKHVLLDNVPVNYCPFGPHPRTQDCKPLSVINWAIVSWRTELVKQRVVGRGDSIYLGNVGCIEIPAIDATDIDNEVEFLLAEALDVLRCERGV
jgi:CMP-N-acetylneuraminic acid synthetase